MLFSYTEAIMSRKRTPLDVNQRITLEQCYANNAGLTKDRVKNLSQKLGLRERTVWIWFLNKKQSSKKKSLELPLSKGKFEQHIFVFSTSMSTCS